MAESAFVIPVGINFADGVTVLPVQPLGFSGTPSIVGTHLPTASISIFGDGGNWENINATGSSIQEPPGSPRIERAEQCTCEHTLEMSYNKALFYWSNLGRGIIVSDTFANIWRILSCDITRKEGTAASLHYVMESISFDSPPDDFELNEVSLDLNIIKHPRYAWALNPYITDSSTYTQIPDHSDATNYKVYYTGIKESIIRMIQTYTDSPMYPTADYVNGLIQNNIISQISGGFLSQTIPNPNYSPKAGAAIGEIQVPWIWDGKKSSLSSIPTFVQCLTIAVPVNLSDPTDPVAIAIAAAKELISKLWRQEDTPYIAGYEIVWSQYFFQPAYINPGGYVEDPRNWVPDYFLNPNSSGVIPRGNQFDFGPVGSPATNNSDIVAGGGVGGESIFDYLTRINPQCYSVSGLYNGALSISSLRKSDRYRYERTWFKIDHTWLIAPIGKWDADLFNQNNRPQVSTDYNQLPASFG